MAILVDDLKTYKGKRLQWCHMVSDTSKAELFKFAYLLGLKPGYYDDNPRHPHFDLRAKQREVAVTFGAQEVSSQILVKSNFVKRRRDDPTICQPREPDL